MEESVELVGTPESVLINKVIQDLSQRIEDPTRSLELDNAKDTAIGLMRKLKLETELLDPNAVDSRERAIMVLALASEWNEATTLDDKKLVAKRLSSVYQPSKRGYIMVSAKSELMGLSGTVSREILAHYWPESKGDMAWIIENIHPMYDFPNVYVFPDSAAHARTVVGSIYEKLAVPVADRTFFAGFANSHHRMALIWDDAGYGAAKHEQNHIDYPGISVGEFWGGLNEAITEKLAMEFYDNVSPTLRGGGAYANQMRLLYRDVSAKHPSVSRALETRYKDKRVEKSDEAFSSIINCFGLEGLMTLALSRPFAVTLPEEMNDVGYISAEKVASRLNIRHESSWYWDEASTDQFGGCSILT